MNSFRADRTGSQTITAGATVTLISIIVPQGMEFEVEKFCNYVADLAAFSNLFWSIRVDGMVHPDYNGISDQIGTQTNLRPIPDGHIIAERSLEVICRNAHASTNYAGAASVQGSFRPKGTWPYE